MLTMHSVTSLVAVVEAAVYLLVLVAVLEVQGRRVPSWHLKMAEKQGPNTCVVEEIPGTNKKFWTECKYRLHQEVCGARTIIRYECCEGFQQVRGKPGCSGVKPMTSILETAKELKATKFVDYVTQAGLADRLRLPGEAMTVFIPTNQAFKNLNPVQKAALDRSLQRPNSPFLLYHIIGKKYHSKDFRANQEIETLNKGDKVRINKYSNGIITVNCVPVLRRDQHSTNGIAHFIDQVLIPPGSFERLSLPELIVEDGRFRELSRAMVHSNHVNELRRGGPYTIFAPSDESFQKISPSEMERITQDPQALTVLLQNHIVPTIICLPAIIDKHKLKTLGNEDMHLECNQSGIFINGAKFTSETMLSSNGVINIVGDVLLPDKVRSVLELMERSGNLSAFSSLVRTAKLDSLLSDSNVSITVFAPSDDAFEQLSQTELEEYTSTAENAQRLLQHHIVNGRYTTDIISDNQIVETYQNREELRLKVYRKAVGVESAIIKDSDIIGQNGVLHIVDRVLTPPSLNIMEMLSNEEEFSVFADAIRKVRETEPHFLERNGDPSSTYTVFAPTNEAFKELGSHKLESLMESEKRLKKVVRNHVVDNMMSSGSFSSSSKLYYNVRTEYRSVNIHNRKGHLMVNGAHVIKPDMLTTDGIVHCIDQVLMPEERRRP